MIAGLGDEVTPVDLEGGEYWALTEAVPAIAVASPSKSVRLLPGFDPYVIGSTSHAAKLMTGDFKGRVHRPQGWVSPVLLVDGRIDGVWRYEKKGKRLGGRHRTIRKGSEVGGTGRGAGGGETRVFHGLSSGAGLAVVTLARRGRRPLGRTALPLVIPRRVAHLFAAEPADDARLLDILSGFALGADGKHDLLLS